MNRLYKKNEMTFAILWIVIYCVVMGSIRGKLGDSSPWMLLALGLFATFLTIFIRSNHLEEKYGLTGWPDDGKRYLYFIPMWILVTGNLWGGVSPAYQGLSQFFVVLSMFLVGYVEELIFRGLLFKALLAEEGVTHAIIISSVSFGIGHIINLFTGQASFETVVQIFFAVAWGFLFTMTFYKSGSLLPGIIGHGLIDVFSVFAMDQEGYQAIDWIYIVATIVVAILYCLYLSKLETPEGRKSGQGDI